MKFIVDAQLPRSLAGFLRDKDLDAIHTLDLPKGNETSDIEINQLSLAEKRVVISKDRDFYDSFTATREPFKLLQIRTGNMSNADLIGLFDKNLKTIISELQTASVVEVTRNYIVTIQ